MKIAIKNKIILVLTLLIIIEMVFISFSEINNFFNPFIYQEKISTSNVLNSMGMDIIKYNIPNDSKIITYTDIILTLDTNKTIFSFYNKYELYPIMNYYTADYINENPNLTDFDSRFKKVKNKIDYIIYWNEKKKIKIYDMKEKKIIKEINININSLYNEYKTKNKTKDFYKKYRYIEKQYRNYKDKDSTKVIKEFNRGGK